MHLLDWPVAGHINELALTHMQRTRDIIQEGLSQRAKAGIKVRQPLLSLAYFGEKLDVEYELIIGEEVNVQVVANLAPQAEAEIAPEPESATSITVVPGTAELKLQTYAPVVSVNTNITPELKREGMSREVIRAVQNARKEAGLEVDDRIHLELQTTNHELLKALEEHAETIHNETLATPGKVSGGFEKAVKVEGVQLTLQLKKA